MTSQISSEIIKSFIIFYETFDANFNKISFFFKAIYEIYAIYRTKILFLIIINEDHLDWKKILNYLLHYLHSNKEESLDDSADNLFLKLKHNYLLTVQLLSFLMFTLELFFSEDSQLLIFILFVSSLSKITHRSVKKTHATTRFTFEIHWTFFSCQNKIIQSWGSGTWKSIVLFWHLKIITQMDFLSNLWLILDILMQTMRKKKEGKRERLRFIINLAIPFPCFSNKIMRKRKKKFHRESEHKKPQATS